MLASVPKPRLRAAQHTVNTRALTVRFCGVELLLAVLHARAKHNALAQF